MDALSDVLRAVRLTGATFFDLHASAPWVAESPPGGTIVGNIFPEADHLVFYHVVAQGACWGSADGEAPLRLAAGDIVVFPRGDPHAISSAPGLRGTAEAARFRAPASGHLPTTVVMGDPDAPTAHVICGFLGCDAQPFNPLLDALPRVIRVSDPKDGVISAFVELAIAESKQPRIGGACMLGRLSELMFVEVIRRYLETLPADRTNWLAALRDPFVGRAIAALHQSPSRAWTIELLARESGLSRSALAERFTAFVGQPPMQYLMNWRMQLAANELRTGAESIAAIAERVGYESEAAFGRAFKKVVGVAPGRWRELPRRSGGRAGSARGTV